MPAKGQPGPNHSAETRKKISDAVRKAYRENRLRHWSQTGSYKPSGFHGRHSDETKAQISQNRKGKDIGNQHGFTKGHIPWNKGKSHFVHNDEWRAKVSEALSGPKHWNWKEGKFPGRGYKTKEWMNEVLTRDDHTCRYCGFRGTGRKIVAHHIIPFKKKSPSNFDVSNGITLCRACHCALHKPRTDTGKSPKPQSS
jgi:5-methylcytosine-specific restriction endonuclease McrA